MTDITVLGWDQQHHGEHRPVLKTKEARRLGPPLDAKGEASAQALSAQGHQDNPHQELMGTSSTADQHLCAVVAGEQTAQ